MKIFGWMQNKFNVRLGNKKFNPVSVDHNHTQKEYRKEEFGDWPHGLLAIGTFGNDEVKKEDSKPNFGQEISQYSQENLEELTPEEVQKLQNDLNYYLSLNKQDYAVSDSDHKLNVNGNLSLEDDPDCLLSNTSVVVGRGKGLCVDNTTSNAINKKSIYFLLKKMSVCRGGFTPAPSLRDQVPESRMEKILRAILHKKIYPQNPSSTLSTKKYLGNNHKAMPDCEDEFINEKDVDNGSKWVKTDSEYIVLEI